ncbi:hypothetical protein PspS34_16835 [Pseudomonas sp. S34]|nr:hypothetical protein PspS34_16835 [Pseudomonas sp. S34]
MWERACSRRRRHNQHSCRLTHRFREQARSHRVLRWTDRHHLIRVCNPLLSRAVLAGRLKPVGSFTWQTPPASTGRLLRVTRHRKRCW